MDNVFLKVTLRFLKKPVADQRLKLLQTFLENFSLNETTVCLDVGGFTEGFEALADCCTGVIVNREVRKKVPGWNLVLADARWLPFKSGSVDILMSNALLEHVVDNRDRLAQEMQRVSKGDMFVSVPYQFAPIEPHYLLPFFQFVPESVKKFLLFKLRLRVGRKTRANYDRIKLFKKKELRVLFPQSRILTLWVYVFPINLVALQKTQPAQPAAA